MVKRIETSNANKIKGNVIGKEIKNKRTPKRLETTRMDQLQLYRVFQQHSNELIHTNQNKGVVN